MPTLANPRHEAYCVNRAAGLKQYEAYVNAGFEANPSSASALEKRPEVKSRIIELIAERQEAQKQERENGAGDSVSDLDREWILRELKQNVKNGQSTGQISAANKALEMMMELLDLGGRKSKRQAQEEEEEEQAQHASDDKLNKALDKLDQLSVFKDVPDNGEVAE